MISSSCSQQRTETIRDLQEQLQKQRELNERLGANQQAPPSPHSLLSAENLQRELEQFQQERDSHENEIYLLQKSLEELSIRLEMQNQSLATKDETINRLMGMLNNKGGEMKTLEIERESSEVDKRKLAEVIGELAKLRCEIDERDRAITSLQEVC